MEQSVSQALALLALIVIISGISLSLDTLGWAAIDQNWQRRQQLIHDLGAYGFLVLIVAHVFWQLLKTRRPQLRSIFTGKIPVETFSANHNWDRWEPHVESRDAEAEKVDDGQ